MNLFRLFRHPKQLQDLTPAEVAALTHATQPPLLLDVRTAGEFKHGHIGGAQSYPLGHEDEIIARFAANQKVVLICKTGHRSQAAAASLFAAGFVDVSHLKKGMDQWRREGRPVTRQN